MLRDEPTLRPGLFRLPDDPVGPRILIPGFRSATSVKGAFGWFTAGWIGRLAPGLAEYLNRSDTSPIEFTVSPSIFAAEKAAIDRAYDPSPDEVSERVAEVFVRGRLDATALARHAIDCLSWMIATGRLRLRIAVPTPDSNYHPKLWTFDDGRDQVVARGSGNATGRGVWAGVEHLDVDVSWREDSRQRVVLGLAMLSDWSRGRSPGIESVWDLPDALEAKIMELAPDVAPKPDDYRAAAKEDGDPPWASDTTEALRARFERRGANKTPRLSIPEWLEWEEGPYAHQAEAVRSWERTGWPERGTIAMATGAGKTLTALICAARAQDRLGDGPFLVLVSAPSIPLVMQWQSVISDFGVQPIAPSLESDTNSAITGLFRRLSVGGTHVLIATNDLLCSHAFQSTVLSKIHAAGKPIPTMLIADEAHTLGAEGFIRNKPDFFEMRLALSATPERQYDPDGTEEIFEFFGPPVYEFGLDRAIGFCLTPYRYFVHAATLDGTELAEFVELTRKIGAAIGQAADNDDILTKLVIARRRIIETAHLKIALLRRVLELRGPRDLTHALIYASAKNPEQFDRIAEVLTDLDVRWAPVTEETTSNKPLLRQTLETFDNGGFQVLLAKKVLDEGVDIPSIREAFIVASSTVQREWIQRRGRVLRVHPSKPWAIVHDFLALPPASLARLERSALIMKIIRTELDRSYSFAAHAQNVAGEGGVMEVLERIRRAYWPDSASESILGQPGDMLIAPSTPRGRPW